MKPVRPDGGNPRLPEPEGVAYVGLIKIKWLVQLYGCMRNIPATNR